MDSVNVMLVALSEALWQHSNQDTMCHHCSMGARFQKFTSTPVPTELGASAHHEVDAGGLHCGEINHLQKKMFGSIHDPSLSPLCLQM